MYIVSTVRFQYTSLCSVHLKYCEVSVHFIVLMYIVSTVRFQYTSLCSVHCKYCEVSVHFIVLCTFKVL